MDITTRSENHENEEIGGFRKVKISGFSFEIQDEKGTADPKKTNLPYFPIFPTEPL